MKETNCCIRCGLPLAFIEDGCAEDKGAFWQNKGEYCPNCYMDLLEKNH